MITISDLNVAANDVTVRQELTRLEAEVDHQLITTATISGKTWGLIVVAAPQSTDISLRGKIMTSLQAKYLFEGGITLSILENVNWDSSEQWTFHFYPKDKK